VAVKFDFIIIGGGIIGLSTAWHLKKRYRDKKILLLEKENGLAQHQTGHNSGVIHAGVYYEPGSLKARFCKEGAAASYKFCKQNDIPCRQIGKLLVATNEEERLRLNSLFERCLENELSPEKISPVRLRELEPEIIGEGAILVRESGIVDFAGICREMAKQFRSMGGEIQLGAKVTGIAESPDQVRIHTVRDTFDSGHLIVCAGLMADRLAAMQGSRPGPALPGRAPDKNDRRHGHCWPQCRARVETGGLWKIKFQLQGYFRVLVLPRFLETQHPSPWPWPA